MGVGRVDESCPAQAVDAAEEPAGGRSGRLLVSLAHAKVQIEVWRREYNEGRPKKVLRGLTPSAYARQLAGKSVTVTPDSKPACY